MFIFAKSRLKLVWITITIVVSALIVLGARIYFVDGPTPRFLLEKGELRHSAFFQTAFHFHVAGAIACLIAGPIAMLPKLMRWKQIHVFFGYVYIHAVLWVAAPAGLMISPTAKGGAWSALGFIVTGVAWWLTTWLGWQRILCHDIPGHVCWMVRSYAIALSAVSFRLIQNLAVLFMDATTGYVISVWLSLAVSLWISETCISRHFPNRAFTNTRTVRFPLTVSDYRSTL